MAFYLQLRAVFTFPSRHGSGHSGVPTKRHLQNEFTSQSTIVVPHYRQAAGELAERNEKLKLRSFSVGVSDNLDFQHRMIKREPSEKSGASQRRRSRNEGHNSPEAQKLEQSSASLRIIQAALCASSP